MDHRDLDHLLRTRRTIRRFAAEHPGRERIAGLIEAATTAPSASNHQGWCFFVTDERQRIDRLAALVSAVVQRIAAHVRPMGRSAFAAYGDYFTRFAEAPVVVAAAYRPSAVLSGLVGADLSVDDRQRIATMEERSALFSLGLAVQNLLLTAHAQGLGASCLTGPLLAETEIACDLGIPASWRIGALLAVGWPAETPEPPGRRPVTSVLRWIDHAPGSTDGAQP